MLQKQPILYKVDYKMNDFIEIASKMIPQNEGMRLKAYDDATGEQIKPGDTVKGYVTIGIGRNLVGKGLSDEEVKVLFASDRADVIKEIRAKKFSFWDRLSDIRKAVLVDMVFNMGIGGLMDFPKMLQALQAGDYNEAALQLKDSTYYKETGRRARRNFNMMKYNRYFDLGAKANK